MNAKVEKELLEIESIYNTRKPKTQIFSYISQRETWDCGIACMAMANKCDYWHIREHFPLRNPKGISGLTIAKNVKAKKLTRYPSLKLLKDFKDTKKNYILLLKNDGCDWGHYVVLDKYNNLYDPEDAIMEIEEQERQYVAFSIEL